MKNGFPFPQPISQFMSLNNHGVRRLTRITVDGIFVLFAIAVLSACGGSAGSESNSENSANTSSKAEVNKSPYSIETVKYNASEKDCSGKECTTIEVVIPQLEGPNKEVTAKINQVVEDQFRELVKSRLPEPVNASWDVMTEKFIEGYELFLMEFPDSEQDWYLHVDGSESQIRDGNFILHISDDEYMGGAHPNAYVILQSFDLATGNRIDVLDRLDRKKLETVAERYFRQVRGLSPQAPLDDEGYMFPGGRFVLPENIALLGDTVWLIYNPYEVAAYSEGATELRIPLSEVEYGGEDLP